jgi:UDP-N-acetylglucosamine 1-carboxyvinyltransferase
MIIEDDCMQKMIIEGGRPLEGRVSVSGAKNSAVALVPAALMANGHVTLENLPDIQDIDTLAEILQDVGANVKTENHRMKINAKNVRPLPMPNGKVKKLRASYYLMGAMLGRFKKAVIGMPGGCYLGPRPIDQHIKGFEALGATVENEHGSLHIHAKELKGARIYLDVVSVGATINIMMAAVMAKGRTVIENAAKEPEIIDVATLLTNMGANIKGAGTNVIRIDGVEELNGCTHSIIPDRIEAGTYMIAGAAMGSEVVIDNVIPDHLEALTAKLRETGTGVEWYDNSVRVTGVERLQPVQLKTLVYPGFPTDLQQPFTALMTRAEGKTIVHDTIYPSRFKHVDELARMGADVTTSEGTAIVRGPANLQGVQVTASDLRAGAALIVAGLMAEGRTVITGFEHVARGYEKIEHKLRYLGADIRLETISEQEMQEIQNS